LDQRLDADSGNSASLQVARGTVLRSLGRNDEARKAFADAILLPDRNLSRYLARVELSNLT
jgi:predicted RNA polymerase sigma factor